MLTFSKGPSTDCLCKCKRSLIITPILRRKQSAGRAVSFCNMFLIFTSLEKQSATKEKYINKCTAKSKFIENMGPEDQWLALGPGKVRGAAVLVVFYCCVFHLAFSAQVHCLARPSPTQPDLALTSPLSALRDHEDHRTYLHVCPVPSNSSKCETRFTPNCFYRSVLVSIIPMVGITQSINGRHTLIPLSRRKSDSPQHA